MTVVMVPRPEVAGEIDSDRADIEVTSSGPIEWRMLGAGPAAPIAEVIETLLTRATRALDELADLPLDGIDAKTAERLVVDTERLRRTAKAAVVSAAGHARSLAGPRGNLAHLWP